MDTSSREDDPLPKSNSLRPLSGFREIWIEVPVLIMRISAQLLCILISCHVWPLVWAKCLLIAVEPWMGSDSALRLQADNRDSGRKGRNAWEGATADSTCQFRISRSWLQRLHLRSEMLDFQAERRVCRVEGLRQSGVYISQHFLETWPSVLGRTAKFLISLGSCKSSVLQHYCHGSFVTG